MQRGKWLTIPLSRGKRSKHLCCTFLVFFYASVYMVGIVLSHVHIHIEIIGIVQVCKLLFFKIFFPFFFF